MRDYPSSGLSRRKSPLKRGGRIKRGGKVKSRNPKRRQTEFARCYHSRERVRFVKGLGCLVCLTLSPFFYAEKVGKCDNAHTETGGMGRKAGYETIVPLCREHHRRYDEHRHPCDLPEMRQFLKGMAPKIEAAWQEYQTRNRSAAA